MSVDLEVGDALPPLHPGEVLREEFMVPLGLDADAVATACKIPTACIEQLAQEAVGVTADTALRLGRYFGLDPQVWLNLQNRFDVETARRAIAGEVDAIKPLAREAA